MEREWDEEEISNEQFWKETEEKGGSIKSTLYAIQDETRQLMRMIEEPIFRLEDDRYMNDEGEDVREIAAKAEAKRDAIREEEVADEINRDHAQDNQFYNVC